MIRSILYLIVTIILLQSCKENTADKEKFQIDDTEYELPYRIPDEKNISDVVCKIADYIIKSTPYQIINEKTGGEIIDFSIPDTNAIVDTRTGSFNLWDYTVGVIHTGMLAASDVLERADYQKYVINNYDFIFKNLPYFREKALIKKPGNGSYHRIINMNALDHCGSIGAALIQAWQINPDIEYRKMIDTVENFIMHKQFRLVDGTLARKRPQKESVWTDDFYMSIPFLVRMGEITKNDIYYTEAVNQVLQLSSYLFNCNKNLFDHGMNLNAKEYDPEFFWSRANGWAMMSITTLLDVLPEDYKDRDQVLKIYRAHIKSIAELQGGNGLWFNILDKNDTYPETSGTAMFVYSMAKAVNEGWIDYTYASVALAGWNGLTMYISDEGEIENMCAGTTFGADMVYYYHRPPSHNSLHGLGPALLAGSEIIKLLRNQDFKPVKEWRTIHFKPTETK
ncbi:MAG: glycoside hydrolase family 88 protein [Bacteroidales bacterium]|nr:glycoside hydrolase family 88 protein [Bacteroidales bacterium]MCF8389926.1 glycoside hydrolase family 88 protein [Bacteroidales bacterium]